MLEIRAVEKRFGEKVALAPTTLTVAAGKTLALLGSSGSGKSTLLRIVAGLEVADEGSVLVDGVALEPRSLPALRLRMGYVIQEGGLFPHMTVEANVTIVARQLGRARAECARRFEELRELVQIPSDALTRFPSELSGGQRQRVALMRALMLDPELVLLDEPLGALDPIVRADLARDLAAIFAAKKKTVIIVTHDVAEAALFGDEIALMRGGAVVQRGPFADLRDRPADPFVSRFLSAHPSLPAASEPA